MAYISSLIYGCSSFLPHAQAAGQHKINGQYSNAPLYNVERQRSQGTRFSYDSYIRRYDRSRLPQWILHCTEVIFSVKVH